MGIVPSTRDIAEMPVSKENLRALFEYLDRTAMTGHECDHSFSLTKSFLREKQLPEDTIMPWLSKHGAGCDCEVMFNVAGDWADVVGYAAPDEEENGRSLSQDKKPW